MKTRKEEKTIYRFEFTDSEMLKVMHEVYQKKVNKSKVLELLLKGKKEV